MSDIVTRLREENEELFERVRQLEEMLAPAVTPPAGVRMTPSELRIYQCLSTGRIMSRDALAAAVKIGRPDEISNTRDIDVYLTRLRAKLAPLGKTIVNHWGRGWQIRTEQKDIAS